MAWSIDGILERIGINNHIKNRVGVAFSGGGAKGFSHIGVLQAFNKFGIDIHIQSGVSAGSIAAVLYGAGLTPEEMIDCFAYTNKMGDFTEWTIPRQALLRLDKFGKILDSWLDVKNIEDLKIPTVICATDFDHGKSVGWAKGEIVPRVLASCSIPIIFPPVRINGAHYVDGGVLRNLPAWAIRQYCGTLYGINCSPINTSYKFKRSIIDITMRSYQLMAKSNTLQDINLCDVVIQSSSLSTLHTFQLSALRKAVTLGYDTACRVIESHIKNTSK